MIDLHCHSIFSDGELIPSELIRRLEVMEYRACAITDHADASNLDIIVPRMVKVAAEINRHSRTKLIPGIELTHVAPELIFPLVERARDLGARIVVCHGETMVEPVRPGTNRAALMAGIDVLAHPGLISNEDVCLARDHGVFLELSARCGHSLANGHVFKVAKAVGARLVVNSDGHAPGDFMTRQYAENVVKGAGGSKKDVEEIFREVDMWIDNLLKG